MVLLKDHEEHLDRLPLKRQVHLAADVARVAAAIRTVFAPQRINYECLGNAEPHVHWHVIPRHADDPQPKATIWVRPHEEREVRASDAEREDRVRRLRAVLGT